MNPHSEQEVVADWITNQETFWAWEVMDKACRDDPEKGWQLVLAILQATDSPQMLANLGAGPLEDLLAKHGKLLIDRTEELAEHDAKFRQCLSNTWQNSMSDDVWIRVCRVTNRESSNPRGTFGAT